MANEYVYNSNNTVAQGVETHAAALTKTYYESTQKSDPRIIVAMTVGHSDFQHNNKVGWPDFDKGIWKESATSFTVTLDFLQQEVVRRATAYFPNTATTPVPKAWNKKKLYEWLMSHPIPEHLQQHKLMYVAEQINVFQNFIMIENEKANINKDNSLQNWNNKKPYSWLRYYHALVDNEVKDALNQEMMTKSQQELDGRNASRGLLFYQVLANKYNDASWVPESIIMPSVHSDFTISNELPLKSRPLSVEEAKKRFVTSCSSLHIIRNNWKTSGSGRTMVSDSAGSDNIPQYVDKDDQQDFLGSNATHVLYFWELGSQHHILDVITQALSQNVTVDGTRVPQIAQSPSPKRRKQTASTTSSTNIGTDETFEKSLQVVNNITSIQALLESKQRELKQVTNLLSRSVENKTTYEIEQCVTDNKKKKTLLDSVINQLISKINDLEQTETNLKVQVSELQSQLESSIMATKSMSKQDDTSVTSSSTDDLLC